MSVPSRRTYLYGLVRQRDGEGCADAFDTLRVTGGCLKGRLLRLVPCGEMAAVVGDLSDAEATALRQLSRDTARATEWVLDHHRTLEELAARHTVLPLRFGTVFADEAAIKATLDARHAALAEAFERIDGAREWGLKIFCDRDVVRQQLVPGATDASTAMRDLQRQIAVAGEGKAFFLARRLDRLAEQETDRAVLRRLDRTKERLAAIVRDLRDAKIQPPEVHGRDMAMVGNLACLVAREAEDAFLGLMDDLRSTCGPSGFAFEAGGPWPAYSFVEERLG